MFVSHKKLSGFATAFLLALGGLWCSDAVAEAATTVPSATEWEYLRDPKQKNFADEVFSRDPFEDEDLLKVYKVQNARLYEDKEWIYNESGKLVDIDYKRFSKKAFADDEYRIWEIFNGIAGKEFSKKYVARYVTFRDPNTSLLGQVKKVRRQEPGWILGVNVNGTDFGSASWKRDMTIVLLHEYAHILTLNKSQVKFSEAKNLKCTSGYTPTVTVLGCAYKASYAAGFINKFWTREDYAHAGKVASESNGKKSQKVIDAYYKKHNQSFVTAYATTKPEEDMAETFVDFILQKKPAAALTKKDQKILYFYTFPELVTMRTKIRASIEPTFTAP
jgi:hypothetical protein